MSEGERKNLDLEETGWKWNGFIWLRIVTNEWLL
jgi:hypothetical protein